MTTSMTATTSSALAVRCLQEELERGLARVARATSARPALPVLGAILLTAGAGQVTLAATDLELAVRTRIGGAVDGAGAIAVPARLLADFVASLPAAPVHLQVDPTTRTLHVTCARARAAIKGFDADDFPLIPPPAGAPVACVAAGRLRDLIGRVAFSAATDEARPALRGVHLQFDGARLTLAAADGYRLTECRADLDVPAGVATGAIVPARGLRELARLLADPAGVVEIHLEPARISFQAGGPYVAIRLIEGAFPDYRAVMPTSATTRTVVATADLAPAVRRAAAFARDGQGALRLTITPAGDGARSGRLAVAVDATEVGDYSGEIDAEVDGPAVTIAFNTRFLAEALGAIATDRLVLETTGATQPGLLRPVGDGSFTHLLMPMHLARPGRVTAAAS